MVSDLGTEASNFERKGQSRYQRLPVLDWLVLILSISGEMKGKVDLGGVWTQNKELEQIQQGILSDALTILPIHNPY